MNAHRLLEYYERIADAPDAIVRLRQFVLDLAVRGKLVSQESNDEPASELLKQIAADRMRRAKPTAITKGDVRSLTSGNPPFQIPSPWTWAAVEALAYVEMGQSPPSEHYNKHGEGIAFFQGKADFGDRSPTPRYWCTQPTKFAEPGDILISVRAPVGPTNVADQRCCIGRGLAGLRPYRGMDREFLLICFRAFETALESLGFGTTFVAINKGQLATFPVPLPPLAEQKRIVARVEELMALCERLETLRADREAVRDQMARASFARLNTRNSVTFQNDARFMLEALPVITRRADQIKQLRQAILNLAVRGQLVPQDHEDESALQLLSKIGAQKSSMQKQRGIRPDKALPGVADEEKPFTEPMGWQWARAQELSLKISDGVHKKPNYVPAGIPFITVKNLTEGSTISFRDTKFITQIDHEEFTKRTDPELGDVLITKDGTIGVARVIEDSRPFSIFVSVALVKMVFPSIAPFLALCMNSEVIRSTIIPKGAALKHLHLVDLRRLPLPVPPLAEQGRIVAKVQELMGLCDLLEANLAAVGGARSLLLNALLAEALTPPVDHGARMIKGG